MKKYRVWLENEYFVKYPLFDEIDEETFDTWIHGACEYYGGVWWIDSADSENEAHGIPHNGLGYIVRYCEI